MKILLLPVLFFSGLFSQTTTDWYTYETKDIAIDFPVKPEESVLPVATSIGEMEMKLASYDPQNSKDSNMVYAFAETVYPASMIHSDKKELISRFFRNSIDGAVSNVKGVLIDEKDIQKDGYPGRQARVNVGNGYAIVLMHFYLVKNNVYILQTIAMTENDGNQAANRFHQSFRLK